MTAPADAQQVSQVLANLLDNARRYAAGRIDVLVTTQPTALLSL